MLGVLLTAFHFWFRDHAEEVIEDMVHARSNGKVNLKLKKFRFNYFSRKMELQNAVFYSTDSINAPAAYQFHIYKIKVELESLWQLVFNGRLLIESLDLIQPDIKAIKLKGNKTDEVKNMSISQEMGRIYNSIHDALEYLGAKKFSINEGRFSLINKIEKEKKPVTISHIHFLVDKTDSLTPDHNPDNMILRSHSQDILLPDGRHRLSFRNLRINIRKLSIEMDSCTISAGKTNISQASFRFFFDTLRLSDVDFSTLYKKDLIKADTVYCTKPALNLELVLNNKAELKKPPSLKNILQPLTGDLQLGYVEIMNAAIKIVTTKRDHSTTFTSKNDNIEISGLHIRSDSSDPMVVKSFAMAIRDYETLSRDSTLAYRFDSIKFNNSKVILSNFTVRTLPGRRSPDARRNYSIPRLELSNLSWDELLFNRKIKASKAILYDPVLNYKRIKPKVQNQRRRVFRDLGNIDAVTELQQLQVIDGQLNLEMDARTKITLEDANILVSSNELLGSRNIKSIQRSLNVVSFGKGVLSINDLKAELKKVHFTGKQDQLEAEEVIVYNPSKTLSATANHVVINEFYYNDSTNSISIDGLEWQQGLVKLSSFLQSSKPSRSSIVIKNIAGHYTILQIQDSLQAISTEVLSITADALRKKQNEKSIIYGLSAAGSNFSLQRKTLSIEAGNYTINDKKNSSFFNTCIEYTGGDISFITAIPEAAFVPDIQEIMKGRYRFDESWLKNPFIHLLIKPVTAESHSQEKIKLTDFYGGSLLLQNPTLFIERQDPHGNLFFSWQGNEQSGIKNEWRFRNITSSGNENKISFSNLILNGPGFSYQDGKGKKLLIDDGEINLNAENITIAAQEDHSWNWWGNVTSASIKNQEHFQISNKGIVTINDVSAGNILLSSEAIKNIQTLLKNNPAFIITSSGGNYSNSNHVITWNRLSYDQSDKSATIDSFTYRPALSRDSFVLSHPYQADYITLKTGSIRLNNAEIESYISDSIFKAGKLVFEKPVITAYRDATKPFQHGSIKYLPTLMIKRFPPFISLDTIQMKEATITYSQVDKKTGKTGTIPLTHLNATLFPVRNNKPGSNDSLELYATALLMDKAPLKLIAKESYQDSLAGIRILLTARPADLTLLNPALVPLVSAKLKSGWLDTLRMDVKADEYAAFGEMKMNYKNLKIAIAKNGDPNSKTLLTRLGNFVLNTFLVKHKNHDKRTGTVYFERLRERSFFNYLVKMTISGIASATGLKKEKKTKRRYLRQQQKRTS